MSTTPTLLKRLLFAIATSVPLMLGDSALLHAQTGSFIGTVFTESPEKPVANAEVVFSDLKRSARTDSVGNFLFSGLPLGKHSVTVRLVGYEPITSLITLVDAKPLEVDLFLKQTTTVLKNVEVKAAAPYAARLVEFEERRKLGGGKFLTAEFFEQQQGRPLSAFLQQKIPGINFVRTPVGPALATNSRGNGKKTDNCFAQIIVNGVVVYDGTFRPLPPSIDEFNTSEIIGFEFYTTATTPVQYNRTRPTGGCGTAIIWTK